MEPRTTVTAHLHSLRQTPRKVRLLADTVRNLRVDEALGSLSLSPRRAGGPLIKLITSAIANARVASLDPQKLYIKEVRVDQGTKLKRWTPRARGSAARIEKRTCHVTIVLGVREKASSRFVIPERPKNKKETPTTKKNVHASEKHDEKHATPEVNTSEKKAAPSTKGAVQRVFRRKAI